MKSNDSPLYPNETVAKRVVDYSAEKTAGVPQWLKDYHAEVVERESLTSNYMISVFQAQAMCWLGRTLGVKNVLEIGVYVGFSALTWADCAGPSGQVTGLEFSPEYAQKARRAVERFKPACPIEIVVGDAAETMQTLNPSKPYDLIFIDAQKSGYPRYLELILSMSQPGSSSRLLRPGGVIVADNVLRRGMVADESADNPHAANMLVDRSEYSRDTDLVRLREFNDTMRNHARLDAVLVPLWDGLGIARLVD